MRFVIGIVSVVIYFDFMLLIKSVDALQNWFQLESSSQQQE